MNRKDIQTHNYNQTHSTLTWVYVCTPLLYYCCVYDFWEVAKVFSFIQWATKKKCCNIHNWQWCKMRVVLWWSFEKCLCFEKKRWGKVRAIYTKASENIAERFWRSDREEKEHICVRYYYTSWKSFGECTHYYILLYYNRHRRCPSFHLIEKSIPAVAVWQDQNSVEKPSEWEKGD